MQPAQKRNTYGKTRFFVGFRLGSREQWSRRQAELFVATQAALIASNEEKAIEPAKLQQHIRNLLKSNPTLAEAVIFYHKNQEANFNV